MPGTTTKIIFGNGLDVTDQGDGVIRVDGAGTISPSSALAVVATTIAGLGTPSDGKIGLLRVGPSPYDYVQLIYDATYGKWVSAEWNCTDDAADNTNSAGATYTALGGPAMRTGLVVHKNIDLKYAAGLKLQARGRISADNSGGSGRGNIAIGLQTVAALNYASGNPAWIDYLNGPILLTITANAQTLGTEFDWTDLSSVTIPGLSLLKYGRIMFSHNQTVASVRGLDPLLSARWTS